MSELGCAKIMLGPLCKNALTAAAVGDDRIRFDLIYDTTYKMLTADERARVDLAQGFATNFGKPNSTFGEALRWLDAAGVADLTTALAWWAETLVPS